MDSPKSQSSGKESIASHPRQESKEEFKFRHADVGQKYAIPTQCMRRPAIGNTTGLAATVAINAYPIVAYPQKSVFQYDVSQPYTKKTSLFVRIVSRKQ